MKIEKWKLKDKEVDVKILDDDEIETNEELDITADLTNVVEKVDKDER